MKNLFLILGLKNKNNSEGIKLVLKKFNEAGNKLAGGMKHRGWEVQII